MFESLSVVGPTVVGMADEAVRAGGGGEGTSPVRSPSPAAAPAPSLTPELSPEPAGASAPEPALDSQLSPESVPGPVGAPAPAGLRSVVEAGRSAVEGLALWSVGTAELRSVLGELEALVRVAQAAQVLVLGEVASRGDALVPGGLSAGERAVLARSRAGDGRTELASVLEVHPATAARRQATVAFVTGSGLPARRVTRTGGHGAGLGEGAATGAALAAGLVSAEAADVVAATVLDLPEHYGPRGRAAVERVLLEHAPEVSLTVLRHHAAGLLARAELTDGHGPDEGGEPGPEGADLLGRAEERAHRRRELYCSADLHGVWHLRGRLAPEAGATLMTAIEALAAPRPSGEHGPDLRSAAQRRADALVALADKALAAPPASQAGLPTEGGARARVVVTMDLTALTGVARGAGLMVDDAPLSPGAVRRLACDAEVVPAVLGTRSEPLDVGRAAYTVTPPQRRALVLRDRGCAAPGCTAPVSRTHAHDVVHWADGGATDLTNLVLVCGHDHRRIHTGALVVHVVDGRPVVIRRGDPPPATAPPPWRARLEDLADEVGRPGSPSPGSPSPGGPSPGSASPGSPSPGSAGPDGTPTTSPPPRGAGDRYGGQVGEALADPPAGDRADDVDDP